MHNCGHGVMAVKVQAVGQCGECGKPVEMEMMFDLKGNFFFWPKGNVEERTETHPANLENYIEMWPGVWRECPPAAKVLELPVEAAPAGIVVDEAHHHGLVIDDTGECLGCG